MALAGFQFNEIGKTPDLLKRISSVAPAETSFNDDDYQVEETAETPTTNPTGDPGPSSSGFLSRLTLFQALANGEEQMDTNRVVEGDDGDEDALQYPVPSVSRPMTPSKSVKLEVGLPSPADSHSETSDSTSRQPSVSLASLKSLYSNLVSQPSLSNSSPLTSVASSSSISEFYTSASESLSNILAQTNEAITRSETCIASAFDLIKSVELTLRVNQDALKAAGDTVKSDIDALLSALQAKEVKEKEKERERQEEKRLEKIRREEREKRDRERDELLERTKTQLGDFIAQYEREQHRQERARRQKLEEKRERERIIAAEREKKEAEEREQKAAEEREMDKKRKDAAASKSLKEQEQQRKEAEQDGLRKEAEEAGLLHEQQKTTAAAQRLQLLEQSERREREGSGPENEQRQSDGLQRQLQPRSSQEAQNDAEKRQRSTEGDANRQLQLRQDQEARREKVQEEKRRANIQQAEQIRAQRAASSKVLESSSAVTSVSPTAVPISPLPNVVHAPAALSIDTSVTPAASSSSANSRKSQPLSGDVRLGLVGVAESSTSTTTGNFPAQPPIHSSLPKRPDSLPPKAAKQSVNTGSTASVRKPQVPSSPVEQKIKVEDNDMPVITAVKQTQKKKRKSKVEQEVVDLDADKSMVKEPALATSGEVQIPSTIPAQLPTVSSTPATLPTTALANSSEPSIARTSIVPTTTNLQSPPVQRPSSPPHAIRMPSPISPDLQGDGTWRSVSDGGWRNVRLGWSDGGNTDDDALRGAPDGGRGNVGRASVKQHDHWSPRSLSGTSARRGYDHYSPPPLSPRRRNDHYSPPARSPSRHSYTPPTPGSYGLSAQPSLPLPSRNEDRRDYASESTQHVGRKRPRDSYNGGRIAYDDEEGGRNRRHGWSPEERQPSVEEDLGGRYATRNQYSGEASDVYNAGPTSRARNNDTYRPRTPEPEAYRSSSTEPSDLRIYGDASPPTVSHWKAQPPATTPALYIPQAFAPAPVYTAGPFEPPTLASRIGGDDGDKYANGAGHDHQAPRAPRTNQNQPPPRQPRNRGRTNNNPAHFSQQGNPPRLLERLHDSNDGHQHLPQPQRNINRGVSGRRGGGHQNNYSNNRQGLAQRLGNGNRHLMDRLQNV